MKPKDQITDTKRVPPDKLLDGRIVIHQPKYGYRSAIDPVFLAAAIPDQKGARVLDVGSGVGAASLCYASRASSSEIIGLELQSELVSLAKQNILANQLGATMRVVSGDLLKPPPELEPSSFDEVMANPPYLRAEHGSFLVDESRAMSTIEGEADLSSWVEFCVGMARISGSITFIHRSDRLDELLTLLGRSVGGIVVFPLWPSAGRPAKRVIVRARRGSTSPLCLASGMTLHAGGNKFTKEAEDILRNGGALSLQ